MKQETINIIRSVLKGDRTATDVQIENVLRACRQNTPQRNLISAQQAMGILKVSRPTIRTYVQRGLLHQITLSARKIRFDEEDVYELAYRGNPFMNAPEQPDDEVNWIQKSPFRDFRIG